MIRLISTLFIAFLNAALFAQAPDTMWTKTFGGSGNNVGYSVDTTSNGGYIIAGCTESFGAGNSDVWLIKTDLNGDTIWTKTFGDSGCVADEGYSVRQTTDGGFVITGVTNMRCGNNGALMLGDVWLIKTDAAGDTLWSNTFRNTPSSSPYGNDWGNSVQETTDGGYIITGVSGRAKGGEIPGFAVGGDVLLIKTDANGDTLWTKTFGDSGDWFSRDIGYSVQQTTDEGYIITGFTDTFGPQDVLLIKTDANGDTIWTRTFGGVYEDCGYSVQQTSDGGYLVIGYTYSFGAGGSDIWIIRTNANGDTLWTKTFGGDSSDVGYSAAGGIITGWTRSFGAGGDDVWVIGFDDSGDSLWSKTIGGIYNDRGYSVQQASDGGYIITGWTASFGSGARDAWLAKLAQDVAIPLDELWQSVTNDYELQQNYPNPFNPTTNIEFSIPKSEFVTLEVYNILGEEVATLVSEKLPAGKYKYDWPARSSGGDASSLASGVYLYRIQAGDYIDAKKMVLLR